MKRGKIEEEKELTVRKPKGDCKKDYLSRCVSICLTKPLWKDNRGKKINFVKKIIIYRETWVDMWKREKGNNGKQN